MPAAITAVHESASAGGFDLEAAVAPVLPVLRETSTNSEMLRHVDPRAIAAMREAGLARLLSPRAFGGLELPLSVQFRAGMMLGGACSAAAWVNMVCAAHTYVVARYPQACLEEVFGGDPDVLIPGTLAPQGIAVPVEGGWRVNGRWQFGSGIDHGPWVLLGALGEKREDGSRTAPVHVVLPASDIRADDTWYTLGMRGSGSKDLVAEDVFVPAHRGMETVPLFTGTFERAAGEGDVGPLYRLPVMSGLATMLAGTVVGFSEAGLATFVDATRVRRDVYAGSAKAAKVGIQMRVAEARAELATARRLIEENGVLMDAALQRNEAPLPLAERVQLRWNAAYAVELCRRALERVFAASGAHAIYDGHPLQRVHRDINTASHHAIVDFDGVAEVMGRLQLGLEDGIGLV